MAEITSLFSGTSGLVLPVTKADFPEDYKDKNRLQYYASLFNSIEINSTFYKLPKPLTVRNWADSVPDHFRFTFKISKAISHAPGLKFNSEDVYRFMEVLENIGAKKGGLLLQFPPSLTIDKIEQLQNLLMVFNEFSKTLTWTLALEFRNKTWYTPEVHKVLQRYNAILIRHDLKGVESIELKFDSDIEYLRFHGPHETYRGSYTDDFLKKISVDLKKYQLEKKTVYVYFNNTMGGAFENLSKLNSFI